MVADGFLVLVLTLMVLAYFAKLAASGPLPLDIEPAQDTTTWVFAIGITAYQLWKLDAFIRKLTFKASGWGIRAYGLFGPTRATWRDLTEWKEESRRAHSWYSLRAGRRRFLLDPAYFHPSGTMVDRTLYFMKRAGKEHLIAGEPPSHQQAVTQDRSE